MIVAGAMSGTSADGINVALVKLGDEKHSSRPRLEPIGHAEFAYPKAVRRAVLAAMNASSARVADLAQLNFLLGELYADAVIATQKKLRVSADLIGCHGQTLYHQGEASGYLGKKISTTWQTGEGAVIAARTQLPVVSDFRPADMAAGGKGAPLVPYLDYAIYCHPHIARIAQNIGGIANLSAIPAGAESDQVVAFDTGPGNMVIDAVTQELFGKAFDRDGRIAARGHVIEPVLRKLLSREFFRRRPPKTAGREQFGREFAREFLAQCRASRYAKSGIKQIAYADVVATATALTASSVADAVRRFVLGRKKFSEMIVSGGGAKNSALLRMLASELNPLAIRLRTSDEFGIPSEAKEAVAFALLAYETWHRRPSNVPSATGAKRPAVLGKISFP